MAANANTNAPATGKRTRTAKPASKGTKAPTKRATAPKGTSNRAPVQWGTVRKQRIVQHAPGATTGHVVWRGHTVPVQYRAGVWHVQHQLPQGAKPPSKCGMALPGAKAPRKPKAPKAPPAAPPQA